MSNSKEGAKMILDVSITQNYTRMTAKKEEQDVDTDVHDLSEPDVLAQFVLKELLF